MPFKILISTVLAVGAFAGTASAQTAWREPLNHFAISVPDGWAVRPNGTMRWTVAPPTRPTDVLCTIEAAWNEDSRQIDAERFTAVASEPRRLRALESRLREVVSQERTLRSTTQRIGETTYVRFRFVDFLPPELRGVIDAVTATSDHLYTINRGWSWMIVCHYPAGAASQVTPVVEQLFGSIELPEAFGATNR